MTKENTISEAFGAPFEATAGWIVDKVKPEECLKIRVCMGEAVQKEINDRINDLKIDKIRSQIVRIKEAHSTSEEVFEQKILLGLRQEINRRFSDISTEFSKSYNNQDALEQKMMLALKQEINRRFSETPLEITLKSLFEEHLKVIQEECDKQKNEINELLQQDSLLKRIEQQDKRIFKFQWMLLAQFGLLVLMALFLFRH